MKEVAKAALVLIFLAFSLNFSASATHASSPASADASLGRRLADLLDPIELLVTMNRRLFRQRLEMNSQNGQLQVLRDKSPQVFAAMESSGEDGIEEGVRKNYDDRQKRMANLFNESLSVSDLENLISYYESPLGKKVVALGFAHMNVSGSQELGGPTSSNDTFDKMALSARSAAVSELTPDEQEAVLKMGLSPLAARFHEVNLKRFAISSSWANDLAPILQKSAAEKMRHTLESLSSGGKSPR